MSSGECCPLLFFFLGEGVLIWCGSAGTTTMGSTTSWLLLALSRSLVRSFPPFH